MEEDWRGGMVVLSPKSLPLGFRFRPTDVELVNHYLKGKISGRIKSEVEVIPEIDVCKYEPCDLPGDLPFPRPQFMSCCGSFTFVCVCGPCSVSPVFLTRKFVRNLMSPCCFVPNV